MRILLGSRLDYLPSPRGSELASKAGPAEGKTVPCEACHRKGRVVKAGKVIRCLICGGGGWRRRRASDEVHWDEYTEQPLSPVTRSRTMTGQEIDAALARIRSDQASREGHHEHETFGWERLRKRRDESGSYVELERALEELRATLPNVYSYLMKVYDENLPIELTPSLARVEDTAVEWLAVKLNRVRVPRWALSTLRQQQSEYVVSLRREGLDEAEIASRVGVSRRFVRNVQGAKTRG